jgi:drug/metabolite transporter (DMT)-like permease
VMGGGLLIFGGAMLLALASTTQATGGRVLHGVVAALAAAVLWGTMYIPYRKAYLTGMNPLSFVAFFTVGELGMMLTLALQSAGGAYSLWQQLTEARSLLFWLAAGGFVWVIGDLFQQYAAKYVGISRGIPLSNTNQLWGLLWGMLVFGEMRGQGTSLYMRVIMGSLIMAAGAAAIAFSSAPPQEHELWQDAGLRQSELYGTKREYVRSGLEGREITGEVGLAQRNRHTVLDWILLAITVLIFAGLFVIARAPMVPFNWQIAVALLGVMLAILAGCGTALWRITRFN